MSGREENVGVRNGNVTVGIEKRCESFEGLL